MLRLEKARLASLHSRNLTLTTRQPLEGLMSPHLRPVFPQDAAVGLCNEGCAHACQRPLADYTKKGDFIQSESKWGSFGARRSNESERRCCVVKLKKTNYISGVSAGVPHTQTAIAARRTRENPNVRTKIDTISTATTATAAPRRCPSAKATDSPQWLIVPPRTQTSLLFPSN